MEQTTNNILMIRPSNFNYNVQTAVNNYYQKDGIEIELVNENAQKEFDLLVHFARHNGRVQTRDYLLEQIWGYSSDVTTRTVDTHIKRLRSKIGSFGTYIETVRSIGYRFNYNSDS